MLRFPLQEDIPERVHTPAGVAIAFGAFDAVLQDKSMQMCL